MAKTFNLSRLIGGYEHHEPMRLDSLSQAMLDFISDTKETAFLFSSAAVWAPLAAHESSGGIPFQVLHVSRN